MGLRELIASAQNREEAAVLGTIDGLPVASLGDAV